MFALRRKGTVIAEGLKIVGSVTAEGLVEVNGHVDGDLHCTSLVVSQKAYIHGGIQAKRVVVNGKVEGPIHGGEVILKSRAIVVGDIETQSLAVERGPILRAARCAPTGRMCRKKSPPTCATKSLAMSETPVLRLMDRPAGSCRCHPMASVSEWAARSCLAMKPHPKEKHRQGLERRPSGGSSVKVYACG